ncbi:hypothetical protein T06_14372 [Trichinella sp. T6]|nr:hypothetical protein T06_14372 [Trichinella sp. T6]
MNLIFQMLITNLPFRFCENVTNLNSTWRKMPKSTALSEHFESSTSDSDVSDHSTLSEFDDDADDFMNNDYSIILKKLQCLEDASSSDRFYTKIGRCFKKFPAKQFLFFGLSVVFITILVRYLSNLHRRLKFNLCLPYTEEVLVSGLTMLAWKLLRATDVLNMLSEHRS